MGYMKNNNTSRWTEENKGSWKMEKTLRCMMEMDWKSRNEVQTVPLSLFELT